jgi:hypothetical protein
MKRNALLVALALAVVPVAAHAQVPGGYGNTTPQGGWGAGRRGSALGADDVRNPIKPLLDRSRELGFTDAQANELLAMMQKLDDDNRPIFEQIARALASAQSGPEGARMDAIRPLYERIQRNNEAAWRVAVAPLTKDQRNRAERMRRDLAREREDERRKRQPRGGDQGLMSQP